MAHRRLQPELCTLAARFGAERGCTGALDGAEWWTMSHEPSAPTCGAVSHGQ